MVCTDAAARGIDIPRVTHVVQSSFAATAVDFLHRVSQLPYLKPQAQSVILGVLSIPSHTSAIASSYDINGLSAAF